MTLDSRILFSKAVEELFGVNYTVINSKSCNFFFFTHLHQSKTSLHISYEEKADKIHTTNTEGN